jgi:protein arginine N-methyltransferase 7
MVFNRREEFLTSSPDITKQTLSKLNAMATKLYKTDDYIGAVAIYSILFEHASKSNRTHPELFICHSNCAAAYMKLEQYEDALQHAARCTILAEAALRRYVAVYPQILP